MILKVQRARLGWISAQTSHCIIDQYHDILMNQLAILSNGDMGWLRLLAVLK